MVEGPLEQTEVLSAMSRMMSGDVFVGDRCFSCGGTPSTGAGEHVIPRWLQRRFELFDERVTLLNGTMLPYRQLTVPCCSLCNNGYLREIENRVINILDGDGTLSPAEQLSLARWMCKILIGLLVKENTLPRDRKNRGGAPIVPAHVVLDFAHAHLIMRSARKPTAFRCLHGLFPFTLYTYAIALDQACGTFDFTTHLGGQSLALRLGRLGAIFVNDGGLQLHAGEAGPFNLAGRTLHPIQFSEVAARVHYKASLRDATHAYVSSETPEALNVDQVEVRPFTSVRLPNDELRVFRPWVDRECAELIARYRSVNWGAVYDEQTQRFRTTLLDGNGDLPDPSIFVLGC